MMSESHELNAHGLQRHERAADSYSVGCRFKSYTTKLKGIPAIPYLSKAIELPSFLHPINLARSEQVLA